MMSEEHKFFAFVSPEELSKLINLKFEVERLREALVFYASFADALPHENIAPLMIDRGKKARAALKEGE